MDKFYEKYFREKNHVFYDSIFSFITGGDTFVYHTLLTELKSSFYIKETGDIAEEDRLLQQLHGFDIYNLEDKESIEIHNGIYDFLKQGKYKTSEMTSLFYYLTADTCPISIDPTELCDTILKILESKKDEHKYHPLLPEYISINNENPQLDFLTLIRDKILEINEYKGNNEHKDQITSLSKLAKEDFNTFCLELMRDESRLRKLLCNLEPLSVFNSFLAAKNKDKRLFNLAIYHRYISKMPYQYKFDYPCISELGELADKHISENQDKKMSTVLLRQLSKYIKESLVALKSID